MGSGTQSAGKNLIRFFAPTRAGAKFSGTSIDPMMPVIVVAARHRHSRPAPADFVSAQVSQGRRLIHCARSTAAKEKPAQCGRPLNPVPE